jgi:Flp pilus assembly protein TadG
MTEQKNTSCASNRTLPAAVRARLKRVRYARRGFAAVEAALVLSAAVVFIFGGMDVAVALIRYNALSDAACRGSRAAAVCGSQAPAANQLGSVTLNFTAAGTNSIATACQATLPTMKPSDVQVTVQWPDGNNTAGSRVMVSLQYQHQSFIPWLLGYSNLTLKTESTMAISH